MPPITICDWQLSSTLFLALRKLNGYSCSSLPCSNLGPDDCDFDDEAGLCIWHNLKKPWYLRSGETSSSGTGPVGDNGGLKGGDVHTCRL